MLSRKATFPSLYLLGSLFFVGYGCGSESETLSGPVAQATEKNAVQMTRTEFHQRLVQVLREGGNPTEIEGVVLGGVCDEAQLDRAFGKPDKVELDTWHWKVSDGTMSIAVESEEISDGKRMLTINGILEYAGSAGRSPIDEQEAPDFDPKLSVEWPGAPTESRSRFSAGTADETTLYTGKHTAFEPATIFSATVHEFTEQSLRKIDSKEMLRDNALQNIKSPDHTLTEIQHQGHPGVEATGRDEAAHFRRVVVLAGRRLYRLEVVSLQPDRLKAEDVTKFFESFRIKD
jgi:hypothetical protein